MLCKVTLSGGFHGAKARTWVLKPWGNGDYVASVAQTRAMRRHLCPYIGCSCGVWARPCNIEIEAPTQSDDEYWALDPSGTIDMQGEVRATIMSVYRYGAEA